jgi:hypothetical protein
MRKHLPIVAPIMMIIVWAIGSQLIDNKLLLAGLLLLAFLAVGITWLLFLRLKNRTLTQALLDLDNNARRKFFEDNGVDPEKAESMLQGWKQQEEEQKKRNAQPSL